MLHIGTEIDKLVEALEKGHHPYEIIQKYSLVDLLFFYIDAGCEAVILKCTHLSCFYESLSAERPISLVDPTRSRLKRIR